MSYPPPYAQPYPPAAPARKRRRVFLWVFLAVQVLFLIWVIAGAVTASGNDGAAAAAYCHAHPDAYLSYADCVSLYGGGSKVGAAVGVGLVIALWAVADIILGIGYGVYRLARRPA